MNQNKSVFITGVLGGIGSATAEMFYENGFDVVGLDRKSGTNSWVNKLFLGDILDEKVWLNVVNYLVKEYGYLDSLINIAGRNYYSEITSAAIDEWRNMFEVNVIGMATSIKYLLPLLQKAPNPSIVNMSSIASNMGSVGYAAYCATKGAVNSMTKSLALELAPTVRINAVAPGWVETEFTAEGLHLANDPDEYREEVRKKHPLDRIASPKEIAKTIYWLSNENASFMTGSVITVDGGYLINNN